MAGRKMAETAVAGLKAAEEAEKNREKSLEVAETEGEESAELKAIEGAEEDDQDDEASNRTWLPWERRPVERVQRPKKDEETVLTRELLSRAKEAFSMYDEDGDNHIQHHCVINALRITGFNPAELEVEQLITSQDPNQEFGDLVDFNAFISILSKVSRVGDTEEEQQEAFSVWDQVGTGNINALLFRQNMTSRGEQLTNADVDEMLKLVKIGEKGEFKYDELIKAMLSE